MQIMSRVGVPSAARVRSYYEQILASSPYQWFKFDLESGKTVADYSGNGRNGTIINTLSLAQADVPDGVDDIVKSVLANTGGGNANGVKIGIGSSFFNGDFTLELLVRDSLETVDTVTKVLFVCHKSVWLDYEANTLFRIDSRGNDVRLVFNDSGTLAQKGSLYPANNEAVRIRMLHDVSEKSVRFLCAKASTGWNNWTEVASFTYTTMVTGDSSQPFFFSGSGNASLQWVGYAYNSCLWNRLLVDNEVRIQSPIRRLPPNP